MGALLCCIPFAALLLWGAVSPRSQWRTLTAWRYRDPAANEPSDAAYAWTRFSSIFLLLAMVCTGYGLADAADRGNRPVAGPSASARPDTTPALRAAFGAERATLVPFVGQQSAAPAGVRAVPILRYQAVEPSETPPWLGRSIGAATRLVVSIDGDMFPAAVVVADAPDRVTVTVYTSAPAKPAESSKPAGSSEPAESARPSGAVTTGAASVYLLPINLAQPLAGRPVIDGSTGSAVA
ncbi:hypothetical protein Dvina_14085 [Dactylosporangium vinaceum]|uniref:DUF6199 domain-containing protein n=1 Tax=Dactylosporangium vinaceum TaxID=53362 RepID=A0ABV5MHL9_9ACTN|nr:hypothetical protein [Dactylosporangium vinaceum]UAB99099.1 hypothetical protein Dvina_14085 [Dactylosporangium vinaceum]